MTEKTAVQHVTSDGGPTNFYSLRRKLPEPQAIFSFTDFCSNAADSGGNVPIMSNTTTVAERFLSPIPPQSGHDDYTQK
jgi:hypothetical protein